MCFTYLIIHNVYMGGANDFYKTINMYLDKANKASKNVRNVIVFSILITVCVVSIILVIRTILHFKPNSNIILEKLKMQFYLRKNIY